MDFKGVVLLVLLAVLLLVTAWFYAEDLQKTRKSGEPWVSPILTKEEVAAYAWVRNNTVERTVFVSDIFGGENLMGATLREGTEGGDWAIIPNVVQRMLDSDEVLNTKDAEKAWRLARQYNASYVWAPNRQVFAGFAWKNTEQGKFSDSRYFELAYSEGGMYVYRVREFR